MHTSTRRTIEGLGVVAGAVGLAAVVRARQHARCMPAPQEAIAPKPDSSDVMPVPWEELAPWEIRHRLS